MTMAISWINKTWINKTLRLSCLAGGVALLGACGDIVYEPSHVSTSKPQVQSHDVYEEIAISALDAQTISSLSSHYTRYGDGGVDLSVTYDPAQPSGAMEASSEAARLSEAFRRRGLDDVDVEILPIKDQGPEMRALLAYQSYSAHAPDDCTDIPGLKDRNIDPDPDYKFGCSLDEVFAKQIARPKDLKGRSAVNPTSDGRKASNIIEVYRTGARNEPLEGESSTGE